MKENKPYSEDTPEICAYKTDKNYTTPNTKYDMKKKIQDIKKWNKSELGKKSEMS